MGMDRERKVNELSDPGGAVKGSNDSVANRAEEAYIDEMFAAPPWAQWDSDEDIVDEGQPPAEPADGAAS